MITKMPRYVAPTRDWLLLFLLVIFVVLGGVAHASDNLVGNCHIGAYRLTDGSLVDIGATDGVADLRWRREDGTTGLLMSHPDGTWTSTLGWTERPDGKTVRFSDCRGGRITFDGMAGTRVTFDITNTRFQGAGITLAGRLVLPKGDGRVPIVVLVHGSEHDSALDFYDLQGIFPAMGIGVFIYDKRGTGASGGKYTQDFLLLADDAIAAVNEAKRLAGVRAGRVGYQAGSEGGWVAPLAAKISPVDFVIVCFGLAVSPLEEDREAIAYDMNYHGFGSDVMAKAMQIADASATILLSNFRTGYQRLDELKQQYGKQPWFKYVHGDVTWALLGWPTAELKQKGPVLFAGVPLQYDPMPVLCNLATPQLWILGGEDADAPSKETIQRLRDLQKVGHPITLAVFPHAEHGIYEFVTEPDGTRDDTRNSSGYFDMMRDYILDGKLHGKYGDAILLPSHFSKSIHDGSRC